MPKMLGTYPPLIRELLREARLKAPAWFLKPCPGCGATDLAGPHVRFDPDADRRAHDNRVIAKTPDPRGRIRAGFCPAIGCLLTYYTDKALYDAMTRLGS